MFGPDLIDHWVFFWLCFCCCCCGGDSRSIFKWIYGSCVHTLASYNRSIDRSFVRLCGLCLRVCVNVLFTHWINWISFHWFFCEMCVSFVGHEIVMVGRWFRNWILQRGEKNKVSYLTLISFMSHRGGISKEIDRGCSDEFKGLITLFQL